MLSVTDMPIRQHYSVTKFTAPATETYSFSEADYAVLVHDSSSGAFMVANGPASLTASETYYLTIYGNEQADAPKQMSITVTVCSSG